LPHRLNLPLETRQKLKRQKYGMTFIQMILPNGYVKGIKQACTSNPKNHLLPYSTGFIPSVKVKT
jgi:hypothetical protein